MRILEYRQKIDSYKIMYPRLCLYDIEIDANPAWNELDGLQRLIEMAVINQESFEPDIKKEDIEPLFIAAQECKDYHNLRFGALDIKGRCLNFGFYVPAESDRIMRYEDRKYRWVKVPIENSDGVILVNTIAENDERYHVDWKGGQITKFGEHINGHSKEYVNLSHNHHVYGVMGEFAITECTPI